MNWTDIPITISKTREQEAGETEVNLYTCSICHKHLEGRRMIREDRCKQCSLLISYSSDFVGYNTRHPALDKYYRPLPTIDALTMYLQSKKQWRGTLNSNLLTRILAIVTN